MNEPTTPDAARADEAAPVFAVSEVTVVAPLETVWKLISDIDEWPSWNGGVNEARLEGDLAVGTRFRWKAGRARIVSTLQRVDRPHAIAWTGRSFGIRAVHEWELRVENGHTIVTTRESWDGPVASLFRRSSQKALENALRDGPRDLKTAAERITAASTRT